jgi:hypothetical protein
MADMYMCVKEIVSIKDIILLLEIPIFSNRAGSEPGIF